MKLLPAIMVGLLTMASTSCETANYTMFAHDIYRKVDPDYSLFDGIGRSAVMDKHDKQQFNNVFEKGPSGQPVTWVNPDSGNNFQVTPQPVYTNLSTNQLCREAEVLTTIDGKPEKTVLTACRNAQGEWGSSN